MKKATAATLFGIVALAGLAVSCTSPREVHASMTFIRPADVRDGVYEGGSFLFPVLVRVRVAMAGGRIERIDLVRHFHGQGAAAEAIVPRVVAAQSLEVDLVSGATQSSVAILKAIEDAIGKGRR